MPYNTTTVVTVGATGTIIPFSFYGPKNVGPFDANGKADLTGYTLTATSKKGSVVKINAAPCVMAPNQVTDRSEGTLTLNALNAAFPAGEYKLKFKAVDGAGNTWYFPTNKRAESAKLVMVDP